MWFRPIFFRTNGRNSYLEYGMYHRAIREEGLVAYYPFEYNKVMSGVNTLDETPEIKDARPVQKVAFDFVEVKLNNQAKSK